MECMCWTWSWLVLFGFNFFWSENISFEMFGMDSKTTMFKEDATSNEDLYALWILTYFDIVYSKGLI